MQTSVTPITETDHFGALHRPSLVGTELGRAFDAVTRLLAHGLDVPVALVLLGDQHRAWVKGAVGLDPLELPRLAALGARAMLTNGLFVVDDARVDARFADDPLVQGELGIRFFAAAPLHTADGQVVGVLCAIDHVPRTLDPDQLQRLDDLAALATHEFAIREHAEGAESLSPLQLRALIESEATYHATFNSAAVGIATVELDGRWRRVNSELCRFLGRSADELTSLSVQDVTYPPDAEAGVAHRIALLAGHRDRYSVEKRYCRPDGTLVWGHATITLVRIEGNPSHFVAVIADVTSRRTAQESLRQMHAGLEARVIERTTALEQANQALRDMVALRQEAQSALERSEGQLRAVLYHALDAFVSFDAEGIVLEWNHQAVRLFGWTRAEAIGRPIDELIVPADQRQGYRAGLARWGASDESAALGERLQASMSRRDGSLLPCEVRLTALPSMAGLDRRYAAFIQDISARKEFERRLAEAAMTDSLTGLHNRRGIEHEFVGALVRARRSSRSLALLFLDLDEFKAINDQYGHAIGDEVLKAFAERVRGTLRASDTVARLAGDEFVVLLEGLQQGHEHLVEQVAKKIIAAISRPIVLQGEPILLATSIGAVVGDESATFNTLLHTADQAMYSAKRRGRNAVCVARPNDRSMGRHVDARPPARSVGGRPRDVVSFRKTMQKQSSEVQS